MTLSCSRGSAPRKRTLAGAALLVGACARAPTDAPAVLVPVAPAASQGGRIETVAEEKGSPWDPKEWFRIRLEQHGQRVPIVDHRAALARETFDIVATMRLAAGESAVLEVHAARYDSVLAPVRAGRALREDLFGPGTGMAEALGDAEQTLLLDTAAHAHWFWTDPNEHRCLEAKVLRLSPEGTAVECRRRIAHLATVGGPLERTAIERAGVASIHLVFVAVEPSHETLMGPERQRDWLSLDLRAPSH